MNILDDLDPHRAYPDGHDDAEMDEAERRYAAEQRRLDDAARAADDERRCDEAAAELSTETKLARGAVAAVGAVASLFERRAS